MLIELLSTLSEDKKSRFQLIHDNYFKLILYICNDILIDHKLVEDAAQDTLIKILNNIDILDPSDHAKTKRWIVVVCERVCYNYIKYESFRRHTPLDNLIGITNDEKSLEDIAIGHITLDNVKVVLEALNTELADIVIFKHYYGYSYKKIADVFEITPAAARKRCERGRKKIIAYLKAKQPDSDTTNGGSKNE